ncbi:MAG: acyltransferase [Oscillospiraceae bacterium]|nr:acyltransferase [Oscillospiraceae bacterium]
MGELTNNKRITWVDTAKCICIIFVLFSHMEYVPTYLQYFFRPFFLTGFFFLSGYTFKATGTFLTFFKKRTLTVFWPALLFSVIGLIDFGNLINGTYSFSAYIQDLSVLLRQQRGEGDVYWFLYVLYFSELAFYFVAKYLDNKKGLLTSFVLCELSIIYVKHFMQEVPYWYVHIIFVAMFFVALGFYFRRAEMQKPEAFEILNHRYVVVVATFGYLLIVIIDALVFGKQANINEYELPQIMWFLTVLTGVLFCIEVAKMLPVNKLVQYCGRNTLVFYLFNDRVRRAINAVIKAVGFYDFVSLNLVTKTITCVVVCIVEIPIFMLISYIINRFFPFLLGRSYKKS